MILCDRADRLTQDSDPHVVLRRAVAAFVARVEDAPRLDDQQLHFLFREGLVLHPFPHYKHLARRQPDRDRARRAIEAIGVITAAVPEAAISTKFSISSQRTGRCSTRRPMSLARGRRLSLVTLSRIESDLGVTYLPSRVMPIKFELPNSSIRVCVAESR